MQEQVQQEVQSYDWNVKFQGPSNDPDVDPNHSKMKIMGALKNIRGDLTPGEYHITVKSSEEDRRRDTQPAKSSFQPNERELVLFVDMDGVMTDLDDALRNYPSEIFDRKTKFVNWKKLYVQNPAFFRTLPPKPDFDKLINLVSKYNYRVLTATPNRYKWSHCAEDKWLWIDRRIDPAPPVIVVPHAIMKQEFCKGANHVLIDDSAINIGQWNARGGQGILHTSVNASMGYLSNIIHALKEGRRADDEP